MSEWISVEDELPEMIEERGGTGFSSDVLVCDSEMNIGIYHVAYPHGIYGADTKPHFNEHCGDLQAITHWMPLPEPPEVK